jgi:hypothetical protein
MAGDQVAPYPNFVRGPAPFRMLRWRVESFTRFNVRYFIYLYCKIYCISSFDESRGADVPRDEGQISRTFVDFIFMFFLTTVYENEHR